jgi:hypothetical protein
MKLLSFIVATLATHFATDASAQMVNLTGKYRCVQMCGGGPGLSILIAIFAVGFAIH